MREVEENINKEKWRMKDEACSCRNRICRSGSRCLFCGKGHDVTCVDVDENKVKLMESGVSPIYEDGLEELMKRNNAAGRLHYTTDYKSAYKDPDAIFIGVGTPEQPDGSANLSYIATVCRQIAENVEKIVLSW